MELLQLIMYGVAILGTAGTFYFGIQTLRLTKAKRRLTWVDLQSAAKDLARDITRSFQPDVAFALSARGATVAHLVMLDLGDHIPLCVGIQEDLKGRRFSEPLQKFDQTSTTKWNNYIPCELYQWVGRRLLIIDDFAISGDSLMIVREFLVSKGFRTEDIRTATVLCTATAKSRGKAPDYYWLETSDAAFYFPWGRAR